MITYSPPRKYTFNVVSISTFASDLCFKNEVYPLFVGVKTAIRINVVMGIHLLWKRYGGNYLHVFRSSWVINKFECVFYKKNAKFLTQVQVDLDEIKMWCVMQRKCSSGWISYVNFSIPLTRVNVTWLCVKVKIRLRSEWSL